MMGTMSEPSVHDFLLSTHHQSCKQLTEVLPSLPKDSLFEIVQSSTEVIIAANSELRRRDKNPVNGFTSSNGFALVPSISKDLNTKLLLQNPSQSKILYQNIAKQLNSTKTVGVIPDTNFNSLSAPKRNHDLEDQGLPSKRPRQGGNSKIPSSGTDCVDGTNGYMLLQFVLVDSPDLTSVPSPADIHCLNERGMGLPRQPDGSQFNIPMRMEKSLTQTQIIERLQHCYTTININDLNVKMAIANDNGKLEEVSFSKLGDLSDQLLDGDKMFLLPCTMIVAPEETSEKSKASRPTTPDKFKSLSLPMSDCEIHVNPPPTTYPSASSISSLISAITSQASLSNMISTSSMVVNNSLNSQLSNNAASILLSPALSMPSGISTTTISEEKTVRKTPTVREATASRRPSTRSSRSSLDPLTLDKKLTVEEKRLLEEDQAKAKLGIHVYRAIPPSEKKTRPTKRCALCLQDSCRRESRYFCLTCEKGFHVRCFIEDHLRLLEEKKDLYVEVRDDNFNLKENGHISEVAKTVNARVPAERAASTSRPLRRTQNGASVAQLTASRVSNSMDDPNDPVVSQMDILADSPSDSERENTPESTMELIKVEALQSSPPLTNGQQLCEQFQQQNPKLSAVPTK